MKKYLIILFLPFIILIGCQTSQEENQIIQEDTIVTFNDEWEFLGEYSDAVVLTDSTGKAKIAVSASMQGRVFTSTADGDNGLSFGWINRKLIAGKETLEHMNPYGGEDRVWLGPEGGQFSIFFKQEDPFDLEHWQTPAAFDTEPFEMIELKSNSAIFQKSMQLMNYSETEFHVDLKREVKVLENTEVESQLKIEIPKTIKIVGFVSINTLTNTGEAAWTKDTGLLSIWILGMFNPSPKTTIIVPYVEGDEQELGPIVNDAYFGKVPADRLKTEKGIIYFRGDGQYRSKIGLSPARSKPILGSYDAGNKVLTIVTYTKPEDAEDYVNSMWELQE
ncbi:MAG: hypothetical protein JW755_13555, partial [Candidatus Aminicenantes bacterium]|nr:hypothetical protein [Candidatus Aminicenantes bacterium]